MAKEIWRPGNMLYPVPAVMVSCADKEGRSNIITVAWAGTVCSSPAMVSISIRPERFSYHMIRETGEFVVNLTTEKLVRAADLCGVKSGRDTDKWKLAGLTPEKASRVAAPLIAESPVNIECRVTDMIPLGSHHMFLGEVLAVQVDASLLDRNGRLDLQKAAPAVYSHGEYYGLGKLAGTFGYSVRKQGKIPGKRKK
ncbi:MAG: flavin reductase family protein [Stomatobaculum sp.]|nr:flavin reductase family protein [Stomatobaculum sp.]MBR7058666.1 flavin reductase family protein [Stomatobaculum sp.]